MRCMAVQPTRQGQRSPPAPPSKTCKHCKRTGHTPELCPTVAARIRLNNAGVSDSAVAIGEYNTRGNVCGICGWGDHADRHHQFAMWDNMYAF